ncbi:M23 family metallopeptidase [Rhodovibrionaceae bacterium A322]
MKKNWLKYSLIIMAGVTVIFGTFLVITETQLRNQEEEKALREAPPLSDATPPVLELPVVCDMGRDCLIQQYVDTRDGEGATDYTCGPLSYNGHKGTDIRVRDIPAMEAGVPVVAAAAGIVKGVRDSEPDMRVSDRGLGQVKGKEAGNGVVIDHGDGWVTQYSHLQRRSVKVKVGDKVEVGQELGWIGMSGKADFPHLHFSVRYNKTTLDPFTGFKVGTDCREEGRPFWSEAALEALQYQAGGDLSAGFADEKITVTQAIDGHYARFRLKEDSPALVFWAVSWGLQGKDREIGRLYGPNGKVIAKLDKSIPKNKARWMRTFGRKKPAQGWPKGTYRVTYRIERKGTLIVDLEEEITLQ